MSDARTPDDGSIEAGIRALRAGGVIAYPTEAVWGLGCDPFDETAVLRLLALKHRGVDKGLILVAADASQLDGLANWSALPDERRDTVFACWPGPQTWIVPATAQVPRWITGSHDGVAVRVSAHPVVVALCRTFGAPLVSTSANRAGHPSPGRRQDIDAVLADALDAIVAGDTSGLERATPIHDARSGRTLRD